MFWLQWPSYCHLADNCHRPKLQNPIPSYDLLGLASKGKCVKTEILALSVKCNDECADMKSSGASSTPTTCGEVRVAYQHFNLLQFCSACFYSKQCLLFVGLFVARCFSLKSH